MASPEEISEQLILLREHRRHVTVLLQKRATLASATPAHIEIELSDARTEIHRIKEVLKEWNAPFENHPDDGDDIQSARIQPAYLPASNDPVKYSRSEYIFYMHKDLIAHEVAPKLSLKNFTIDSNIRVIAPKGIITSFSIVIFFRSGPNGYYRLYINADNLWGYGYNYLADDGRKPWKFQFRGSLPENALNLAAGQSNRLIIHAEEQRGRFLLNDIFVGEFDLSDIMHPGTIRVGVDAISEGQVQLIPNGYPIEYSVKVHTNE